MDIHSILKYFRDYESEVRFQQSTLEKTEGNDYAYDILHSPERIEKDLLQRKLKDLLDKIMNKKGLTKRKPDYGEDKKLKDILLEAITQNNSDLLNEALIFNNDFLKKELMQDIQEANADTSCYICYPLLEKGKARHPLFIFETHLEHELIIVENININLNALILFIASVLNQEKSETEIVYKKEIQSILREITNLEAPATIDEGIESALAVINRNLPNNNVSIHGYKDHEGWTCLSTVYITSETLMDLGEPPFRQEIELVESKLKEGFNKKPSTDSYTTLQAYLLGNKQAIPFETMRDEAFFHYGSYTNAYAVNKKQWQVIGALNATKLLAVNGPPGTGKTTLLKEIIAEELVQKGEKLVDIWDEKWEYHKESKVYISPMNGENNHSIMLTSSNNKAVDNIGEELLAEVPYFHDFVKDTNDLTDGNITGFMCARLGKKDNINEFRSNVLEPFLKGLQSETTTYEQTEEQVLADFNSMLKELKTTKYLLKQYWEKTNDCVEHKLLEEDFSELKTKTTLESELEKLSIDLHKTKSNMKEANDREKRLTDDYQQTKEAKDILHKEIADVDKQEKELYQALEQYLSFDQKKWLSFLPKRKKFLKQYPSELYIRDNINKLTKTNKQKAEQLDRYTLEMSEVVHEINELKRNLQKYQVYVNTQEKMIKQRYSEFYLLEQREQVTKNLMHQFGMKSTFQGTMTHYDLIHVNDEMLKQRHALFKQALLVMEHYIWKHRKEIRFNIDLITKDNHLFQIFYSPTQKFSSVRERGLRVSWETLFLCFPVVTTTLHSFKVHNFHMLDQYIDLLLVDESGQVLPQYLVGPLYRSRRALIVGDILQIEPVRPMDNHIIENTAIPDDKQELYDITKNSAQHFADRHSGVYEKMGNQLVGIILEEHRRCESAIASFSNNHVYDGKLDIVNKDDQDKLFGTNLLAIDVRGKKTSSNVNHQETAICKQIVFKLVEKYGEAIKKEIGIITPFRHQQYDLTKQIKGVTIGTVHTFQGQEKEIIIFSAAVQARSISFVGGEPNLLNVAVTRAKKQFIFISNFEIVRKSRNYLLDLLDTINKYGEVFSVYDTDKNSENIGNNQDLFQLFVTETHKPTSEFGQYLHDVCPENIITGANNHLDVLLQSFSKAEKRIDIISPWLNPKFIEPDEKGSFKRGIDYALARNIDIQICFGYHKNAQASLDDVETIYKIDQNGKEEDYVSAVNQLRQQIQSGLKYTPPLHVKVLVVDREYLIIGSHNWLSNQAVQTNPKEEISVILTEKQSIDYVIEHFKL